MVSSVSANANAVLVTGEVARQMVALAEELAALGTLELLAPTLSLAGSSGSARSAADTEWHYPCYRTVAADAR